MATGPFVLPPDTSDQGLEGYRVLDPAGAALGVVAAVNRGPGWLVLLVARDGYRALPAAAVVEIDTGRSTVLAAAGAVGVAPPVAARAGRPDDPRLVRHVPHELAPRLTASRGSATGSLLLAGGAALIAVAGYAALAVHLSFDRLGPLGWGLWAVPFGLFCCGAALLFAGSGAGRREQLASLPAFLLGSSPWPTARR